MPDELVYINGVDGASGQYLVDPLTPGDIATLARGEKSDEGRTTWLRQVARWLTEPHLGLPLGVDATDPGKVGWGLVLHEAEPEETRAALLPLVDHRGGRIFEYRAGEGRRQWLARHGVAAGSVVPAKVPYYLLLVGSPARIPYEFQFALDVEYAVGRLDLDMAEEYRLYVQSVIAHEGSDEPVNSKTATFFGTRHAFDPATCLSADQLVSALAGVRPGTTSVAAPHGFATRALIGKDATKVNLESVFKPESGKHTPAFCFTATHGLGWPRGHPNQLDEQGALVCQEWKRFGAIDSAQYFRAEDLSEEARVAGMITFHFACYGAGTPKHDNFSHIPGQPPPLIADDAFSAKLPKRLLAHPAGSALAVVGHVERAWGYSIVTPQAGAQLLPFTNAIEAILDGLPVGYAIKDFNDRYAVLSTELTGLLEELGKGASVPDGELALAWLERNDAQNYVVLGDPATRLRHELLTEEDEK